MNIAKLSVFVMLVMVLSVGISFGKEAKKMPSVAKETAKKEVVVPYLTTPFDINIQKVLVPFVGHDIEKIFNSIEESSSANVKGEFETTEQFKQRIEKQSSSPFFASIKKTDTLAFVFKPQTAYDADSETLTVSIGLSPVWESVKIDRNRMAIGIKTDRHSEKKSMRQNKMGAQIEVSERYYETYELALLNHTRFDTERILSETMKKIYQSEMYEEIRNKMKEDTFVFRIKMGVEEAKAVKDYIYTLFIVNPAEPFTSKGAILSKATFDNPSESLCNKRYLNANLAGVWIYNSKTGTIIEKRAEK